MFKRKIAKIVFGVMLLGAISFPQSIAKAAVYNGWELTGTNWSYYTNGARNTGWLSWNGHWYFLNSNGVMATGWITDGGQKYFLKSDGSMAIGWLLDSGNWYYFYSNGSLALNTVTPDGYTVGANGVWDGKGRASYVDRSLAAQVVNKINLYGSYNYGGKWFSPELDSAITVNNALQSMADAEAKVQGSSGFVNGYKFTIGSYQYKLRDVVITRANTNSGYADDILNQLKQQGLFTNWTTGQGICSVYYDSTTQKYTTVAITFNYIYGTRLIGE